MQSTTMIMLRALRHGRGKLLLHIAPLLFLLAFGGAEAAAIRDRLTLLVPDGADRTTWQIKVWTDSAAEEGIRLDVITDSAFLQLGTGASSQIAGLIVPDSAHQQASAALVTAISQYATNGGNLMLVYDAGVLDERGFFPLTGNSRFKNLVGVDYAFYGVNGAGASTMVGFGPAVGTRGRLDSLSFPPGKYLPYVAATTARSTMAPYVAASASDPSGTAAMTTLAQKLARPLAVSDIVGPAPIVQSVVTLAQKLLSVSPTLGAISTNRSNGGFYAAKLSANTSSYTELAQTAGPAYDDSPFVISGYLYGALGYYSYVTSGTFPGTVWLSSPDHGLVAGQRTVGSGKLLFVNVPLGYFKAQGTDGAPLHGFLSAFARDQVGIATMSTQPRGVGGLIYNWHIDNNDQLNGDANYLYYNTTFFNRGPYSIHFTAGPDIDYFGQGTGVNLNGDSKSRDMLMRLGNIGKYSSIFTKLPVTHEIGAHGGWIHNYWAANASETNAATFTQYLQLNYDAVNKVAGDNLREYSSPGGNTPSWAATWLEAHGVVAMYLTGDIGGEMMRSWRFGKRLTNKLWTSPVNVYGKYATWEEFDEQGIPDSQTGQWLLDMQSFAINHRTNRMFYNHAPGARAHVNPINAMLTRSDSLQAQGVFKWYTMSSLADFSQRRVDTTWTTSSFFGFVMFQASHPQSLQDQTWLLPKSAFSFPVILGFGTVTSDANNWIVTANGGTSFSFTTQPQ